MRPDKLEPFFTEEEKETRLYRFVNFFLSDEQKESLILSIFATIFATLSHVEVVRRQIMDDGKLIKASTSEHRLIMLATTENKVEQIFYRPRKGILVQWKVLKLPEDMWALIRKENNLKEVKKVIGKVMKMKAFW